ATGKCYRNCAPSRLFTRAWRRCSKARKVAEVIRHACRYAKAVPGLVYPPARVVRRFSAAFAAPKRLALPVQTGHIYCGTALKSTAFYNVGNRTSACSEFSPQLSRSAQITNCSCRGSKRAESRLGWQQTSQSSTYCCNGPADSSTSVAFHSPQ